MEIFQTHHRRLKVLAYRLVGDGWEDVLQDAYVRAFRSFPAFQASKGSVGAWLATIVYRLSLDELERAAHRGRRGSDVEALANLPSSARVEPGAELGSVLSQLPDKTRAAVLLVDLLDFTYDEAAAILGVSRATLATRLSAGRSSLRLAVTESSPEEAT
jgi:RNA polymerase sigma-70 factor (ECF subfamily)